MEYGHRDIEKGRADGCRSAAVSVLTLCALLTVDACHRSAAVSLVAGQCPCVRGPASVPVNSGRSGL